MEEWIGLAAAGIFEDENCRYQGEYSYIIVVVVVYLFVICIGFFRLCPKTLLAYSSAYGLFAKFRNVFIRLHKRNFCANFLQ